MNAKNATNQLAFRLQKSGDTTRAFFGGLRRQDWQHTVYREGSQWPVRAVLAHFVSAESAVHELLHHILSGEPGVPVDFDIDAFNESEVKRLGSRDPQELLLDFKAARAATVALVEGMSATDLQRRGRHPWLGNAPLSKIIKLIYQHNQIHERDARRALRKPDCAGAHPMTDASKTDIRDHTETNHQRLLDVVARLNPSDFDLPVYGGHDENEWHVRNVIAHLEAAAAGMLQNARAIAAGEDPVPPDFDLHRWNQSKVRKAADVPVKALLDNIERSHQKWMQFLEEIPVAHLQRRGRHALGDVLTVEGFMCRYAEHEAQHASEIHSALQRN